MQQGRLGVRAVVPQQLQVVVDMAVGDEAIRPAVVVEIRQAQPQPTQGVLSVAMPLLGVRSSNIPSPRFMNSELGSFQ